MIGRLSVAALATLALVGCASGPPQPSNIQAPTIAQGKDGRESGRGTLSAYNSGQDDRIELKTTLDGGEGFSGPLIQHRSTAREYQRSVYQPPVYYRGGFYYPDYDTYTPQLVTRYETEGTALLMGDKGRSMSCRFTFTRPNRSIFGGGFGECSVSDGTKLVVPNF
ncbi:hypothetical protein ACFSM5_12630 [Lacibacterium aquatile]|uniref:Secreted protein n=1 Tax=Lacibacterium aquatile TaxID=1168082 RepID=A0ABW5DRI0_9PROT